MPTRSPDLLNLPNAISLVRIALAPFGMWLAGRGNELGYQAVFAVAVLSDFLDGWIARRTGRSTEWGARIDALADALTYLALFFAASWLWPEFLGRHAPLIAAALWLYTASHAFSVLKFRRLSAYHSWAGKTAAVLMAAGMLLWFVGGPEELFTLALVVALVSGVEQLAMTALLRRWRVNVPTAWHAWRERG